jgi:hypothetical protein
MLLLLWRDSTAVRRLRDSGYAAHVNSSPVLTIRSLVLLFVRFFRAHFLSPRPEIDLRARDRSLSARYKEKPLYGKVAPSGDCGCELKRVRGNRIFRETCARGYVIDVRKNPIRGKAAI